MIPVLLHQHAIRQRKAALKLRTKAPATSAIERLARRLEPQLRKRFLEAVKAAKSAVELDKLARAISGGNISYAELHAKLQEWPERFGELAIDLRAGFLAGGGVAYEFLDGASANLRFDSINPHAVNYAQRKLPQIVQQYGAGAKEIIRAIVAESVSGKYTADEAARLIRDSIGLTPQYERAVRRLRDELISQGITGERLETKVDRYAAKLLRARAKTIARTEIIQAEVSGQRALWNEAALQGLFNRQTARRMWRTNHEGTTDRGNPTPCPICTPMNNQTIAFSGVYTHPEMGDVNVFGEVLHGPPLHPNCLCEEVLIL